MHRVYRFLVTAAWALVYGAVAAAGCAIGLSAAALVMQSPASSQGEMFASRFDDEATAIQAATAVIPNVVTPDPAFAIVPDIASPQPIFPVVRDVAVPEPVTEAPRGSEGPRFALRYGVMELVPDGFAQWTNDQAALLRATLEAAAGAAVQLP